jgi:hypothetical protein
MLLIFNCDPKDDFGWGSGGTIDDEISGRGPDTSTGSGWDEKPDVTGGFGY